MNLDLPCYKNPSALVSLQISNRRKSDLGGLERYKNLTELDISGNLLTSTVNELFSLKFLKKLNLCNNQICSLYPLPRQLESLNLSENLLNDLDENLLSLSSLHTLDISFNHLESIESLSRLPKLKCLYVNNNKLQALVGIEHLNNLIELDLSDNQLKTAENIQALNINSSLVVVNIENNPVTLLFQSTFAFTSAEEFPKDFYEISLGLYFRSPEKLRKIKSSRYRSVIKEFKNREKLHYASPDWGNSKIEDDLNEEESFDEKNQEELPKISQNEENEEIFGKRVVNIAKLDLEKISEKACYGKSSTKPESSLEGLFDELISYCQLEESKESNFSSDKYENAINVLKGRENERLGLVKSYEKSKTEMKSIRNQVDKVKDENQELLKNIEKLKKELNTQDLLIFNLMNRQMSHVEVQTDLLDEQFLSDSTLESGLSSFSQLPDFNGEYSRHVGGNEYMVHNQIGIYVQKLLEKISDLVKKKKKLRDENKKLNNILRIQRANVS